MVACEVQCSDVACSRPWKVREAFKRLDHNKSGTLMAAELARVADSLLPFTATAAQLHYFR